MLLSRPVLIVAQSGRALATSAAKAGIATYVIDRFADRDTSESAVGVRTVNGAGSSFNIDQLLSVLSEFTDVPLSGVIAGSGLESEPEILDWISNHWALIGNSTEVIKRCKDPSQLFTLLDGLGISHPEIRFEFPDEGNNWLIKRVGGAGGEHIFAANDCPEVPENCYLQKKLGGRNLSAIFLADGSNTTMVGCSETWTVEPELGNFAYSGAVSLQETDVNYQLITDITRRLVSALQLKGLCGIDFITDDAGTYHVLEVNPRPTATFELHENRGDSLLQAHMNACMGELIPEYKKIMDYRGHRIIYTDTDLAIPDIRWPDWTTDRPAPEKIISAGMPVCTIHAMGGNTEMVKAALLSRAEYMQELLEQYRLAA